MAEQKNIAIIGGGASGVIAAITAAQAGANVVIYEKNNRVGKKILMTGNGRCNFTNESADDIAHYHGENPDFVIDALKTYNVEKMKQLFNQFGIFPLTEDEGKVFPAALQASAVLDVLRYQLEILNIDERTEQVVTRVEKKTNGVAVSCGKKTEVYDALIVATGGCAAPKSGSDGNGLRLMEKLGHHVVQPYPVLTQVNVVNTKLVKIMKGVKIKAKAQLVDENGMVLQQDEGDVLFTDYGLSGPPILQMSGLCAERLKEGKPCGIRVAIFQQSAQEVLSLLQERQAYVREKTVTMALVGLVHKRMIIPILQQAQIMHDQLAMTLTEKQLKRLSKVLTEWTFDIASVRGFEHAQATGGGVNTWEINSETMESLLVPNVYLAGELLDVYGDCGGYNLHWAWASGMIAGNQAAKG
jgi:predicted Rossmann fold flavoprotein